MGFTHNNNVDKNEPPWGDIDKSALPRNAFAETGEAGKKSTWGYPHHWIKGGTKKDSDGIWLDGTMYLHKGGLNAAWAAANGARSGKKASKAVLSHLKRHRESIGVGAIGALVGDPWLIDAENLKMIYKIASREGDLEALAASSGEQRGGYEVRGSTGIINIVGPIFRYANLFTEISGATATGEISRYLGEALADNDVERIVLVFDSPGGQVTGIAELAEQIREASAQKDVIAYVDGAAASAAYWLASAAGQIVGSPTAIVGSIGVVSVFQKSQSDEIEIVSSNAPNKRANPESPEGRKEILRVIDDIAEVFTAAVAKGRGVSVDVVNSKFGRGGVLVGQKAVEVGMMDKVGSFENLIKEAKMELSVEVLEKENPELLERIKHEAAEAALAEAQARADAIAAENSRLKMEAFRKDLVSICGEKHGDLLMGAYDAASGKLLLSIAEEFARLNDVISKLGAAQGEKGDDVKKEVSQEKIAAYAKEKGISLVEATIELEKEAK